MNCIALLGAGFSRNWGGWLASEAFEYLLGSSHLDAGLRDLLWKHKRKGGFEAALAELQENHFRRGASQPDPQLLKFQDAILQMFDEMDAGFESVPFEIQQDRRYLVGSFLVRFDAIFTLNQDLLLERHYLNGNVTLSDYRQWDNWQIPGMKRVQPAPGGPNGLGKWTPDDPSNFGVSRRHQPLFKLHGSSNWVDADSHQMLVLGGNKASIIQQYPILKWNHAQFKDYLLQPDTRLMVIGYSFSDDHINNAIMTAAAAGNLRMFVIDPLGVDVMDRNRLALVHDADELAKVLWPHVSGASRRSLREIFGSDRVEHSKVMKFFL